MTGADAIAHAKIGDVIDRARAQYRQGYYANANMLSQRAFNLINEYVSEASKEKEYGQGTKL